MQLFMYACICTVHNYVSWLALLSLDFQCRSCLLQFLKAKILGAQTHHMRCILQSMICTLSSDLWSCNLLQTLVETPFQNSCVCPCVWYWLSNKCFTGFYDGFSMSSCSLMGCWLFRSVTLYDFCLCVNCYNKYFHFM